MLPSGPRWLWREDKTTMAYIEINGAQIYYETFGPDQPGQAPVLLIHGSTNTGQEDWGVVAPLLARRRHVIVPDCRGHGHSSNPSLSYSFKEMADDLAALVRQLGYERAHVIGHSNGGNVALVFLMEHPEVVQSAALQAANAYVSQDLIDKEPAIFDPQRVERESPAWRDSMIALHGVTHGPDYWRDLLRLTLQELITQPNYTPQDLQQVQRPTLVVQGQNDRVNAPARHAQFIAGHIPYAELWIPAGVGHNVHFERLFEWVERIESFLDRRGDEANEALYRLGEDRFGDSREWIFDLKAQTKPAEGKVSLSGSVLVESQRRAAIACIQDMIHRAPDQGVQVDEAGVSVLLSDSAPWALVNWGVIDLLQEPDRHSERVSQALLGETVRILEEKGDWVRVRTERDGYLAWARLAAIHRMTQAEASGYLVDCRARVIAELLPASRTATLQPGDFTGKLPFGVTVRIEAEDGKAARVRLPDGRGCWVRRSGLLPFEDCPKPDAQGIAFTLDLMRRFIGTPYLWGGRSPFGFDCSGFAGAFWGFMGVVLPRDADQQFRQGIPVEGPPQPGDLIYFGEPDPDQPNTRYASIDHVAISLGGDEVLHATSGAGGVVINSLDPASPYYRPWLRETLTGVRRFV
jgi:gamma-D-glutamyl-L-lysine dipeptidyl-peptidase